MRASPNIGSGVKILIIVLRYFELLLFLYKNFNLFFGNSVNLVLNTMRR